VRLENLGGEVLGYIQRMVLLQMIDSSWRDHLSELDQVRKGIGFRAYGHKDPKIEYQKESFALFESMMRRIRDNTVEYIFNVRVEMRPSPAPEMSLSSQAQDAKPALNQPQNKTNPMPKPFTGSLGQTQKIKPQDLKKIGRNDPCPCGSGKKYKKCCGKNA
jgi:preprotein translocase subunit SecA